MFLRIPTSDSDVVAFEVPGERLIADCRPPQSPAPAVARLLRATINAPLGYPPLNQAILPGDHVTLAVDPDLPQVAEVVGEVLNDLIETGANPADLTVLLASEEQRTAIAAASPAWNADVKLTVHDPEDEATHAYLAATSDGRPIYLNRVIGDADVFIPVGVQRLSGALDDRGVHGGWFPAFSSSEAQARHQSPGNIEWQAHRRRRRQETEEAAWLLGARLVIQIVPGPAGGILGAWCGDCDEVARGAGGACQAAWSHEVERPAELVLAVIDGETSRQSWPQVARALAMAAIAAIEGGVIVLWTNLAAIPGPALMSLSDFESDDDEQRLSLLKQRSADAMAAKVVADCLLRYRVYLHCQLNDGVLEGMGLTPLHDIAELQRLVNNSATVVAIGSAQYTGIHVKQPVEA